MDPSAAPVPDQPLPPAGPSEDAADLARFIADRSQAAFAALVERHLGTVRATCCALLGPRHPWLDDACQAVFLILARKAGEIRDPAALPAWLRATARGAVANVRRAEGRRRERERAVAGPDETTDADAGEAPWGEAAGQLDAAIALLTEAQREAVVRHFLQGKRQAAIAEELGVSEGAVKKRIADAMATLRAFFARRGMTVPALIAAAVASDASAASPDLVADCAAAGAGHGSAAARELCEGTLRDWVLRKAAGWIAVALGAVAAVAIAWWALPREPRPERPAPAPVVAAGPGLPIARAEPVDPEIAEAILAPIRALRRNDLRALLATLPPANRELIAERWRAFAATPAPMSDALADMGLASARQPDAFDKLLPLYRPLPLDLRQALRDLGQRYPGKLDPAQAALIASLGDELERYLAGIDLNEERIRRMVVARGIATGRLWPFATVAEFRAMPFDRVVDTLGPVLGSLKAWWTPYGLDLDRVLDSVVVTALAGSGDMRAATVRFTAFGVEHATTVRLRHLDGHGWQWLGLEGTLEPAFMDLGHFFFLPAPAPALSAPAVKPAPRSPG